MTRRSPPSAVRPRGWLRRSLAWLLALLGLLAIAATALAAALLDTTPALTRTTALTPEDIQQVRALWELAQPLRQPQGEASTRLAASGRDLDLMAQEAAVRLLKGSASVMLRPAGGEFNVSARVPPSILSWPTPLWLNVSGSVRESAEGLPELTRLKVGSMPVPPPLALWLARTVAAHTGFAEPLARGMGLVTQLTLEEAGVTATLRSDPAFVESLRSALVPPALRDALQAFNARLVLLAGERASSIALWELVAPMFDLATERSAAEPGDEATRHDHAALQNRAALLTLALYVNARPLSRLVPAARDWPQPPTRLVLGAGREDHPQHLLLGAVLAAEAGGRVADALGILKEVSDRSSTGSGFSFDDIAADRAGKRLGQLAVRDPVLLQRRLAAVKSDADLLPPMEGLPSFLDDAAFRAAFGAEGSPRYQALIGQIDARVAAVPALR